MLFATIRIMNRSQTVLITGATSGIGYELGRIFSRNGFTVILVARDDKQLKKTADNFSHEFNNQTIYISLDLSLQDSPKEIYNILQKRQIDVDILVNNAGFGTYGDFAYVDLEKHLNLIHVNITSLTALTRLFLPAMLKKKTRENIKYGVDCGISTRTAHGCLLCIKSLRFVIFRSIGK